MLVYPEQEDVYECDLCPGCGEEWDDCECEDCNGTA